MRKSRKLEGCWTHTHSLILGLSSGRTLQLAHKQANSDPDNNGGLAHTWVCFLGTWGPGSLQLKKSPAIKFTWDISGRQHGGVECRPGFGKSSCSCPSPLERGKTFQAAGLWKRFRLCADTEYSGLVQKYYLWLHGQVT